LGFICIIFRDLVGGGGSANSFSFSFVDAAAVVAELRRLVRDGGFVSVGDTIRGSLVSAGGGSSKARCSVGTLPVPSFPLMSVDDAGVGGRVTRGIFGVDFVASLALRDRVF
jgi:hypothetical protein